MPVRRELLCGMERERERERLASVSSGLSRDGVSFAFCFSFILLYMWNNILAVRIGKTGERKYKTKLAIGNQNQWGNNGLSKLHLLVG